MAICKKLGDSHQIKTIIMLSWFNMFLLLLVTLTSQAQSSNLKKASRVESYFSEDALSFNNIHEGLYLGYMMAIVK